MIFLAIAASGFPGLPCFFRDFPRFFWLTCLAGFSSGLFDRLEIRWWQTSGLRTGARRSATLPPTGYGPNRGRGSGHGAGGLAQGGQRLPGDVCLVGYRADSRRRHHHSRPTARRARVPAEMPVFTWPSCLRTASFALPPPLELPTLFQRFTLYIHSVSAESEGNRPCEHRLL